MKGPRHEAGRGPSARCAGRVCPFDLRQHTGEITIFPSGELRMKARKTQSTPLYGEAIAVPASASAQLGSQSTLGNAFPHPSFLWEVPDLTRTIYPSRFRNFSSFTDIHQVPHTVLLSPLFSSRTPHCFCTSLSSPQILAGAIFPRATGPLHKLRPSALFPSGRGLSSNVTF